MDAYLFNSRVIGSWALHTAGLFFMLFAGWGVQWLSGRVLDLIKTEGPRVRASQVSLCCVLEQDIIILA